MTTDPPPTTALYPIVIHALAAVLLLTTPGCGDSTGPAEEEEPQDRILFVRDSGSECTGLDCSRDIYGMNLDGTELENLTDLPADYMDLRLSPDRTRLAFGSTRSGCPDLWIMNIDGSDLLQLTGNEPGSRCNYNAQWSPDGEWLAFYSSDDPELAWEVHVIAPDGSGRSNVTGHPAIDVLGAVTADGRIVFWSDRSGVAHYYVAERDGSGLGLLFPNWMDGDPQWSEPYWSADGTMAALRGAPGDTPTVYVGTGDPQDAIPLGPDATGNWPRPEGSFGLDPWSPDGSRLAFQRAGAGGSDVWVVNADGSGLTNVTSSTGDDRFTGWSPDGTRFLFASHRDGDWDIYMARADGSEVTNLTNDPSDDLFAVWVPPSR